MKFSVKDFFAKREQIRKKTAGFYFFHFLKVILGGKLRFFGVSLIKSPSIEYLISWSLRYGFLRNQ